MKKSSRNAIEFENFYLIKPKLEHFTGIINGKYKQISKKIVKSGYTITTMKEKGNRLKKFYNYSSKNNFFLKVDEIKKQNKSIKNRILNKEFIFLT